MKLQMRFFVRAASMAALVSISCLPAIVKAQAAVDAVEQQDIQARTAWRETMHQTVAPARGCFHATYPSTFWEEVECAPAPAWRSALPLARNREQVVGNGHDYVFGAPAGSLISLAKGSFPTVKGVTSEKGVGVAAFGDGGILGTNEYTLQVNTNFYLGSAACAGYKNCVAWQQYVLSTNTPVSLTSAKLTRDTEVFIEYWLIDYGVHNGRNICPTGFIDSGEDSLGPGDDCVQNTPATLVAKGQLPITDLASLTLSGSASAGGTDAATVTYDGEAYTATVVNSYTDMASGWTQAEFNVFGNAGGSEADFNSSGVSITVKVAATDGSSASPTCVAPSKDDGTTGETNNLKLGSCTATGGRAPYIEFTETN